jgi:DNA-binding PadR family transcriptional regulator
MSRPRLGPTSFVVLGAIAWRGPSTSYDLKQFVARSIGYFWSFPHAQLYSEPGRLADAGLLTEEREEDGRRRRIYTITPAGREALGEWLREPTLQPPETRDLGLLKLFFGDLVGENDVIELARAQHVARQARLDLYRKVSERLAGRPELAHQLAVLGSGLLTEEQMVRFWAQIAERPPGSGKSRTKPA